MTLFLISTKAKRWSSNQYVYIQRKKTGISPFQLSSPSTKSESQLIRDPASDIVSDSWVVLDRLELPSPPMSFTFFRLTFFGSFVVVSVVWLASLGFLVDLGFFGCFVEEALSLVDEVRFDDLGRSGMSLVEEP